MENNQTRPQLSPELQHNIQLLNVRLNDLMGTMNGVFKILMDENAALKKENAELKAKQAKTSKT
ncbi:MAG: hypothetical protein LBI79_00870 [Nitrososphaerota archaeon]|jgi:regulator of replication initiation timing|nr:hypothetical protein [Nitrososphaerota archaeon]